MGQVEHMMQRRHAITGQVGVSPLGQERLHHGGVADTYSQAEGGLVIAILGIHLYAWAGQQAHGDGLLPKRYGRRQ